MIATKKLAIYALKEGGTETKQNDPVQQKFKHYLTNKYYN